MHAPRRLLGISEVTDEAGGRWRKECRSFTDARARVVAVNIGYYISARGISANPAICWGGGQVAGGIDNRNWCVRSLNSLPVTQI